MGTGASSRRPTDQPVSPRVTEKQELLDSPALLDLGHGTIRYRHNDVKKAEDSSTQDKKTGYFYHPRIELSSADPDVNPESDYKCYYVFKGPPKMQGTKLYYVYGKGFDAKDSGLRKGPVRPTGKGFTWPKEYFPANSVFYDLQILYQAEDTADGTDDNTSVDMLAEEGSMNDNTLKFTLHSDDTLLTLKGKISLHNGLPLSLIHVQHDGQEVKSETVVGNLRPYVERGWNRFTVLLTPS
ncbi:uncharacterized protein [Dysidea avara]|uniref:uncharacterized protein n=1 Tax=Dysidea avara TaxID=196820 RepID=UPI00331F7260